MKQASTATHPPFSTRSSAKGSVAIASPSLASRKFDTLSKAPGLRVPTLVIHGDSDEVVPFAMGREVAAAIPGATLRVVAGGHHNDLFLAAPTQLVEAIVDAVRR